MLQFSPNLYLHGLNLFPQFGPKRLMQLLNFFNTAERAFNADIKAFTESGIEPKLANKFITFRQSISLEREKDKLELEKINLLSYQDTEYPVLLKEIPSLPPLLYYRGKMNIANELALAVVGTRKITQYGSSVIPYILSPIIDAGVTIISGLAYGVDATAHRLVIRKSGRTIGLLGSGIDTASIYPKNHVLLAEEIIAAGGAIVSEYPPGTPAFKQHFIARNRIISGLSIGTLLIECNLKSGTLITAKHALDQNRNIYAIPGPIYSETSQGPNNLIKMGAHLVTDASDILADLNIPRQHTQKETTYNGTPQENAIITLLSSEPTHIDELINNAGIDAATAIAVLTFLEIKGRIRNIGGGKYMRA